MTNKDKWKNTENRQALSDEEVAQASGGGDMSWGCNTPKCMGNYLTGILIFSMTFALIVGQGVNGGVYNH